MVNEESSSDAARFVFLIVIVEVVRRGSFLANAGHLHYELNLFLYILLLIPPPTPKPEMYFGVQPYGQRVGVRQAEFKMVTSLEHVIVLPEPIRSKRCR